MGIEGIEDLKTWDNSSETLRGSTPRMIFLDEMLDHEEKEEDNGFDISRNQEHEERNS